MAIPDIGKYRSGTRPGQVAESILHACLPGRTGIMCPVRPCSCHRADGLAKLRQRDAEEDKPDHRESDELRPYDVQSRAAIENGLGQQDEMGRGGCQYHCLDESGPALDQGVSMLAMIAPSLSRSLADKGSSAAHPATRHLMRQTRH